MEVALGIFIGGIISGLITYFYYKKASNDLKLESDKLRKLNTLMLLGMEHAGWIELQRNEEGDIIGFKQTINPVGIRSEVAFGNHTIIQEPANTDNDIKVEHDSPSDVAISWETETKKK